MSVSYLTGCVEVPAYVKDCCPVPENGRVRAVAFVRKDFAFANDDLSDATEWERGITEGKIIIVPDVRGSIPAATFNEEDGYGDRESDISSLTFELTFFDRNYGANCATYNALMKNGNYRVAYATENYVHLSDLPAVIMPAQVIPESNKEKARYEVKARFTQYGMVCPQDRPADVFDCDF